MGLGAGLGVGRCEEGEDEGEGRLQRECAELLSPSLAKLRQLLLVLDAEFRTIRELHNAGELRMLAPRELLSLLDALFDNAALRDKQAGREFVALLERP